MEQNKDFTIVVEPVEGELIIRQGKAAEIHPKNGVKPIGAIGNPVEYARKRAPSPGDSHVRVNRDQGVLKLVCGESLPCEQQDVVTGVIDPDALYQEFKINANHPWDANDLAKLFKRRRKCFPKVAENLELVKALSNFKAAIETNLEKIDDKTVRRFKTAVEKTVNSGLPQSFTLKMPIIKGEQEIEFAVDVILEAGDGRVSIFLDSIEAEEFADEIKNTAIEKQLEYLREHYVVFEE